MAILNPEHLLEQAEQLIVPPAAGPPRQVNIRRAISAAYYGLFHATLIAAADQFIGVTKQTTPLYSLVYRAVDHRALRSLCEEIKKSKLSAKYLPYEPSGGFGSNLMAFALAVLELQEKRHEADYNPMIRMKSLDAQLAIATARAALTRFEAARGQSREAFLTLLLFPPR
ncbi:conserved hypothetical protein [Bradyrhizobium sp. STM 3843]|uniref:hypothetical protein n=1 Tax=Bradyrhizobium sp. STM 3843 TaxID=551947 RepID=UPI000240A894|nr:hypothetical protein [Bradyrhizobium sp. STM 3843]CCE04563.1 conserved hypothetical protein [Bradyrhizobium sp. STM 3843]